MWKFISAPSLLLFAATALAADFISETTGELFCEPAAKSCRLLGVSEPGGLKDYRLTRFSTRTDYSAPLYNGAQVKIRGHKTESSIEVYGLQLAAPVSRCATSVKGF